MITLNDIKREYNRLSELYGDTFSVAVKVNNRLVRTHGQCISELNEEDGYYYPSEIHISERMLQTATDETIMSIIRHEWVHYYLGKTEPWANHGHDAAFKHMCAQIGCTGNATDSLEVREGVNKWDSYKYVIVCPHCGPIGGRVRICDVIRHPEDYKCRKCGRSGLKVRVNK